MNLKPWPKGKVAVVCLRFDHPDADRSDKVLKKCCYNCHLAVSVHPSSLEVPLLSEFLCMECAAAYAEASGTPSRMLPMTAMQLAERWDNQEAEFYECPRCNEPPLRLLHRFGRPMARAGGIMAWCSRCGQLGFVRQDRLTIEFFPATHDELRQLDADAGMKEGETTDLALQQTVFALTRVYVGWRTSRMAYTCRCGSHNLGTVEPQIALHMLPGDLLICKECGILAIVNEAGEADEASEQQIRELANHADKWHAVTFLHRHIRTK